MEYEYSLARACGLLTFFLYGVVQVLVPTEALVAWCQEQKSGRRLGKNFKRRKDFLRDLEMLPDGFPVTLSEPLPDSLITATQVDCHCLLILLFAKAVSSTSEKAQGHSHPYPSKLLKLGEFEIWQSGEWHSCQIDSSLLHRATNIAIDYGTAARLCALQ